MPYLEAIYKDYSVCCDDFKKGIDYLKECSIQKAVHSFHNACQSISKENKHHNMYVSYCGFAKTLNGEQDGLSLCRKAAHGQYTDAALLLNLARAEWFTENRKNAVVAVQKGLEIDASHSGLVLMQEKIGLRRRSAIPFVARDNPLNNMLGKLLRK